MEFVYVLPRTSLFPDRYPLGLLPFGSGADHYDQQRFTALLASEAYFVERPWAERQPSVKQVIPYNVIRCEGKILLVRRLAGGGEARLADKYSIGIGGHVNPVDRAEGESVLDAGTRREIEEELDVRGSYTVQRIGLINDDTNAVGAVHVGLVQVVDVTGTVAIRETDRLEGRLVSVEDLRALVARGANLETWSRLLIERLDLLTAPAPTHTVHPTLAARGEPQPA
jgi:predicted NUDIX family phosphoesterase